MNQLNFIQNVGTLEKVRFYWKAGDYLCKWPISYENEK